jgi:hypothetical protein
MLLKKGLLSQLVETPTKWMLLGRLRDALKFVQQLPGVGGAANAGRLIAEHGAASERPGHDGDVCKATAPAGKAEWQKRSEAPAR